MGAKIVTDTVMGAADQSTTPPPVPAEWNPGGYVRDDGARCWRFVPSPAPALSVDLGGSAPTLISVTDAIAIRDIMTKFLAEVGG